MLNWLNRYSGALQVIIAIVALCITSTVIFSIIKKIGTGEGKIDRTKLKEMYQYKKDS